MDEKELVKRVKNSFRAKKSRSEILSGFQKRGYKLAYADKLITRAKRPKQIATKILITSVLFFTIAFLAYVVIFGQQKFQISNPLLGLVIAENSEIGTRRLELGEKETKETAYDQVEITPDLISFLLNEIGAWQLHKNPLTFESPVVNFRIGDDSFYSEIGNKIKTYRGLSEGADLQFNVGKQDLIDAILSDNPKEILKEYIVSGKTQIDVKVGEAELFAKGYLGLYESLN